MALPEYLSFIIHLRNKRVTDNTGQEAYVATMLRQGEYGFFPILKASSINYDSVVVTGSGDGRGEVGCTAESLSTGVGEEPNPKGVVVCAWG